MLKTVHIKRNLLRCHGVEGNRALKRVTKKLQIVNGGMESRPR